jgi:hypothetical protein
VENTKGPYDDLDFTIPKGAKEEARRGLDWVKEHGRGGTSVGRNSARYILNNTTAGAEKVRHIAKYFPRHESDKAGQGWSPGEDGYPSNGRIAWALWGGNAGRSWSQKLVRAMNARDEKVSSALELIKRRNAILDLNDEIFAGEFESEETKTILWKQYDNLLSKWDYQLTLEYFQLFKNLEREINTYFKNNPPTIIGIGAGASLIIDKMTADWKADLYEMYLSLMTDFAYAQIETLLPEQIKNRDEDIIAGRQRKPRMEVITGGFFRLRNSNTVFPIEPMTRNKEAIEFVTNRLDTIMPELAKTTKKRLNVALRVGFDKGSELGLVGQDLADYVQSEVSNRFGLQRLGRSNTIARTEAQVLAQFGKEQAVKRSGVPVEKQWITRRDNLVRDPHRAVDNARVNYEQLLTVGGYKMKYPGDSSFGAPANLVVNCRCDTIYHRKRNRRRR